MNIFVMQIMGHPKNSRTSSTDHSYINNTRDDDGLPEEHFFSVADQEEIEEVLAIDDDTQLDSFSRIIGCIEDIVIDDQFQDLQESLLEANYHHFDTDKEENKLIYTSIFENYTTTVEEFIEKQLEQRIEHFCMKDFIQELEDRKMDLEGDVFEMLFTLTDFLAFKDMFVDYKITRQSDKLDDILCVTSL